jgi:hypothetical protein
MGQDDAHEAQRTPPMVILDARFASYHGRGVKHRHALLAATALALLIAMLFVGRARAAGTPTASPAAASWIPGPTDTWQYQLSGVIDTQVDAAIFDVDAFDVPRSVVAELHALGRHAVCYIDAGSWESYRPDAGRFPESVLGRAVPGWPDERWLDIRRLGVLRPILRDRLDRCARKGFDGVEYDWIDGFALHTGFPLTRTDQLRFDRWLARAAHRRGLAVGLKNGLGLIRDLVDRYDFAVNEQCFGYHECGRYGPFLDAGKLVVNVEYDLHLDAFCDRAAELGIVAIRKHLALGPWRQAC